jgi:hypothetical protein
VDSGGWALIGVAILGLVGTIYMARQTRKASVDQTKVQGDSNDISEFEANIRAFDLRARNAEARAAASEKKSDELLARVEALERKDGERDRQLNRIRLIVQAWFRDLLEAWSDSTPMPLPSEEDLDLLGITIPRIRKN